MLLAADCSFEFSYDIQSVAIQVVFPLPPCLAGPAPGCRCVRCALSGPGGGLCRAPAAVSTLTGDGCLASYDGGGRGMLGPRASPAWRSSTTTTMYVPAHWFLHVAIRYGGPWFAGPRVPPTKSRRWSVACLRGYFLAYSNTVCRPTGSPHQFC